MTQRSLSPRLRRWPLLLGLAVAGCGAVGVPDSGRGVGGPRPSEVRAGRSGGAQIAALTLAAAPAGAVLPFGQMATACGTGARALGTAIEEAAGYVIYDTGPGSTEPRTHYVTGFADGCPRQVTAAFAVLGDPATHEVVRYGGSDAPYGPVDAAYETIKGQVCGVASGQPCGAAMDRLSRDTTFLSVYPVFGADAHADTLFHAGEVVAVDPAG